MNKVMVKVVILLCLTLLLMDCTSGSSSTSGSGLSASQVTPPNGTTSADYGVYYNGNNPYSIYAPTGNASNYSISMTPILDSSIDNTYLTNLANGGNLVVTTSNNNVWTVALSGESSAFESTANYESTSFINESANVQTLFLVVESADSIPYLVNGSYDGTNYVPFFALVGSLDGAESIPSYSELCAHHASGAEQHINAIAEPNLAYNQFVVFGNDYGDVCSYNVITNVWRNFTESSTTYTYGSKILSISVGYTSASSLYHNYFVNESGQIWVATVNLNSKVTGVSQLNESSGPIVTSGGTTVVYADLNNNLYVGEANGYIYGLANGSTTWQSIHLVSSSGVYESVAVSAIMPTTGAGNTTIGANSPQAIMANGHVYNLSGL